MGNLTKTERVMDKHGRINIPPKWLWLYGIESPALFYMELVDDKIIIDMKNFPPKKQLKKQE